MLRFDPMRGNGLKKELGDLRMLFYRLELGEGKKREEYYDRGAVVAALPGLSPSLYSFLE